MPWDDKELKVDFATFRDRLRPGQSETWRVTVTGATPGATALKETAELLAYMYDRSLDAFAPHHPPSPALPLPEPRSGALEPVQPRPRERVSPGELAPGPPGLVAPRPATG